MRGLMLRHRSLQLIMMHADVTAQVEHLREAARDRLRAEVRRTWDGAPDGLAGAVAAVALPAATDAMREAAVETVWRTRRRGRINLFPISHNLSALMALVMADLSESQRETLMSLIYQRDIALTDLTLHQFLITLFHAPKSSLENPNWSHKSGPRSFVSISYENLTNTKDIGYVTRLLEMKASLMSTRISSGCMTRISASG